MDEKTYQLLGITHGVDEENITDADLEKIDNALSHLFDEAHRIIESMGYEQVMGVLTKLGRFDK